jgi:UDPglucose 6-dehydrogenase
VIFMAVGTPSSSDGSANLAFLFEAAADIGRHLEHPAIIVNKSTVPVGTAERVARIIGEHTKVPFVVASNPEFLKEGAAVEDFMSPDRVVIGTDDEDAREVLHRLYKPFFRQSERIVFMSARSAEITKYACNAYLATRISFVNDIANLCDLVGADVESVRTGMGTDPRIGNKFLYPGVGYGGSCFPKDTRALINTAREHGMSMSLVAAAERINEAQKLVVVRKVRQLLGSVESKTFALWGLAFKPNTDDVREAPALRVARTLLNDGAKVRGHDPEAGENFVKDLGAGAFELMADPYDAAHGAHALLLMTEWRQYRSPDFERLKAAMADDPVIVDGRNQWDRAQLEALGFRYVGIGR